MKKRIHQCLKMFLKDYQYDIKCHLKKNIYVYEFHATNYKNDFLGCIKFCEKS